MSVSAALHVCLYATLSLRREGGKRFRQGDALRHTYPACTSALTSPPVTPSWWPASMAFHGLCVGIARCFIHTRAKRREDQAGAPLWGCTRTHATSKHAFGA